MKAAPPPFFPSSAPVTAGRFVVLVLLCGGPISSGRTWAQDAAGATAKPGMAALPAGPTTKKSGRPIVARWDFEGGRPIQNVSVEGEPPQIVPDPLNPRNKVMLSTLKPNQARAERSELRTKHTVRTGEERWVGLRILRPDPVQNGFTCFFQLGPISGAKGTGGSGLYQLSGYGKDASARWKIRGFLERLGAPPFWVDLGPVTYGQWDRWVFHLKLRADSTGLFEAWRNGTLVANQTGPNALPGDHLPIKWGVYVGKGNPVPNEIHALYDDITIAGAGASYADVEPPRAPGKR